VTGHRKKNVLVPGLSEFRQNVHPGFFTSCPPVCFHGDKRDAGQRGLRETDTGCSSCRAIPTRWPSACQSLSTDALTNAKVHNWQARNGTFAPYVDRSRPVASGGRLLVTLLLVEGCVRCCSHPSVF
jgi:hypothetical protein